MTKETNSYLTFLHSQINQLFSIEELRIICLYLNLDYENLAGEGKSAKIHDLLVSLVRRDKIIELAENLKKLRPNATWNTAPDNFELKDPLLFQVKTKEDDSGSVIGDKISAKIISSTNIAIGRGASIVAKRDPEG